MAVMCYTGRHVESWFAATSNCNAVLAEEARVATYDMQDKVGHHIDCAVLCEIVVAMVVTGHTVDDEKK